MKTTAALALALIIVVTALGAVASYIGAFPQGLAGESALAASAEIVVPTSEDSPKIPVARTHASAGCYKTPNPAQAGTSVRTLTSGGVSRSYRVHYSASAEANRPMPVVLNFHGRGGTGAAVEEYSGLLPVSDRQGFFLVSPDGTGSPAGWGAGASLPDWPVDDIQFGRDLLTALKSDLCIDTSRVYAVGHSNGAFMAARLACELNGEIAAIAPVAGVYVPPGGCSAVPVLAFHGTADDVVPFGGGPVRGVYVYRGAENELSAWAATDHCADGRISKDVSPRVTVETSTGCTQPVKMVLIKGAGHGWPGVAGTDLAGELDTANMIWDFFKDQQSLAQ
ncbi:MAG: hypothetical protein ABI782_02770 [Anaerolineaceae bacterium]